MLKIDIIQETVDFYSENPVERRSIVNGRCVYNGDNGARCAVGRCVNPNIAIPEQLNGSDVYDLVDSLVESRIIDNPTELFQEKYKGHEREFWAGLQNLHDNNEFWSTDGLTAMGKGYVEDLKFTYKAL